MSAQSPGARDQWVSASGVAGITTCGTRRGVSAPTSPTIETETRMTVGRRLTPRRRKPAKVRTFLGKLQHSGLEV